MAKRKTIWDLSLEIAGKDTGASKALRQVKQQLADVQAATRQLGGDWKTFTSNAGKLALGVTGVVAGATAGVVALANNFASSAVEVERSARAINMCSTAFQQMQYAMAQSHVAAGEFDNAMRRYNQTIMQAAAGSQAAQRQLAEIGLSGEKLAAMGPERALLRLSDYLKSLPSDAERTAVALKLFGNRAGPQMAVALSQGSDAIKALMKDSEDATFTFSQQNIELSKQFVNTRENLKGAFENVKFSFIAEAIGPVTEALETVRETILSSIPSISELGQRFGQWLNEAVKRLPEIIEKIQDFGAKIWNGVNMIKDFVGGWRNLALIIGGLVVAPTLISGLKVVWSLGNFIMVAFKAIGPILVGLKGGFVAIAGAALPIVAIVAGITAVIFTVIRNFDILKQFALDSIERIKSAFGSATGGMGTDWKKAGETIKSVLRIVVGILESAVLFAIKTVMNVLTSAIKVVIGAFRVLWNVIRLIFWPLETVIRVIIGLFTGGFSGALDALTGQFGKFGEIIRGIFGGIKTIISSIAGLLKRQFQNAIEAVIRIVDGLAERFSGIKNIIGTVGNTLSNLNPFNRSGRNNLPGHAEGGIFRHRHIAEICEKGAEAVVPLNNTSQGFDIWKQAGELGGYLKRVSEQTPAVSAAAHVAAARLPIKSPEPSTVMTAATQKISSRDTVIKVDFKMTNNFNGGTPGRETARQISEAGQKAGDDFESRVKTVFESIMRDRQRVSYA